MNNPAAQLVLSHGDPEHADEGGCPVRCWNSRVANSVPAVDESTLRDLFDADRGWGQPIEGSDEMVHVAVASNPPEALFRFQ